MRLTYIAEAVFRALHHNRTGEDKFMACLIWRDDHGCVTDVKYATITDIFTAGECAVAIDMTTVRDDRNGQ